VEPIILYQNRQVVLSQLSPFSGEYLVKLNRSVERPETFATVRVRRVTMHKWATRRPPVAFSAPKQNRPPSRPDGQSAIENGARIGMRELPEAAKVSTSMITRFERVEPVRERTVDAIRAALEVAGVEFVAENGGRAGLA
jgi:hypothetical protein